MIRVARLTGVPLIAGSVAEMSNEWMGVLADVSAIESGATAGEPDPNRFVNMESETYRKATGR